MQRIFALYIAITLLLVACGTRNEGVPTATVDLSATQPTPTPENTATPTPIPPTATSQPPTPTPEPTAVPLLAFDCETISDISVAECAMVLALFNSTGGQNWTMVADDSQSLWFTNTEACSWKGLHCRILNEDTEQEQAVVVNLTLSNAGLNGRFPPNFALENLENFGVSLNPHLIGPLPEKLDYTNLFNLFIDRTGLEGPLSNSIFSNRESYLVIKAYNTDVCLPAKPDFHRESVREGQRRYHWGGVSYCDDGLIFDCSQVNTLPVAECEAVVRFYQHHYGDFWRSDWLQSDDPCTWEGITCTNNHITELIKPDDNFNYQPFSPFVGMQSFFSESFPDLSDLTHLTHLDLSVGLDEERCDDFTNCYFNLPESVSHIGGALPEWFGDLSKLESLNLFGNPVYGSIPESWGALTNLHTLNLNETLVSGPLPLSLANSALTEFQVPLRICAPNESTFSDWLDTASKDGRYIFCKKTTAEPFTTCKNVVGVPAHECEALVAFYEAHNGENWTFQAGWLKTNTPCEWVGLVCENGQISRIQLVELDPDPFQPYIDKRLQNPLTGVLGNLSGLKEISLFGQFFGELPPSWGQLKNLELISIPNSNLVGSIPTEWGEMANLRELDLSSNKLTGELPSSIGNWTKLEQIDLSGTPYLEYEAGLSGDIPDEIRQWASIREINFDGNNFNSDKLPIFGHLTTLERLILDGNDFYSSSNSLPIQLTNLTNLYYFHLSHGDYCIPQKEPFLSWSSNIEFNRGGHFKNNLCETDSPDSLDPYLPAFNCISFVIATFECGALYDIRILNDLSDLRGWFNDEIPICDWEGVTCSSSGEHVEKLRFPLHSDLKILPADIGYLRELTSLVIFSPNLKAIPVDIGRLSNLNVFAVWHAKEIETLPSEIGNLTNLTSVSINDTAISKLPIEFWNLPHLKYLVLSESNFVELPEEIGRLSNLTRLAVAENNLTTLPAEVQNLTNLRFFFLDDNPLCLPNDDRFLSWWQTNGRFGDQQFPVCQ